MQNDEAVEVWNLMRNYIDKKQMAIAAERFVDLLADFGFGDQEIESCIGYDSTLDSAIMYYLDDDFEEEDD